MEEVKKINVDPIEQLKAEYALELAARDAVFHRLIGVIEHCVLYLTSPDGDVEPPKLPLDPEVN